MEAQDTGVFRGPVPTAPDVQALLDKFGVPSEGTLIKYEELEALLGYKHRSCRFRTVLGVWRRRLEREHRRLLITQPTVGVSVANAVERLTVSHSKRNEGMRAIFVGSEIAQSTDRWRLKTPEQKRELDHNRQLGAAFKLAEQTAAKKLLPSN